MKITGSVKITLGAEEKTTLKQASRILSDLADQLDTMAGCDDDLIMELNRAFDTCRDISTREFFEYELDDGNE